MLEWLDARYTRRAIADGSLVDESTVARWFASMKAGNAPKIHGKNLEQLERFHDRKLRAELKEPEPVEEKRLEMIGAIRMLTEGAIKKYHPILMREANKALAAEYGANDKDVIVTDSVPKPTEPDRGNGQEQTTKP